MTFHRSARRAVSAGILIAALGALAISAQAQYFGRNKVLYEKFQYKVLKTEHFDIYFYPEEEAAIRTAARMAERWYRRFARLFNHDLRGRQPLIMYASHPEFEQTTVLPELIEEGTGGVTESFKRRIILPFGASLEDTDHVIGHELVHAFQYDMAAGPGPQYAQAGAGGLQSAPLWVVEGAAEYFSIGPVDAHTAMWMRDMIRKKKIPTIKELSNPYKYFPYRYGQALYAYIGGRWGDLMAAKIVRDVCRGGDYEKVLERNLSLTLKKLSEDWQASLKKDYQPFEKATLAPTSTGRLLIKGTDTDMYNVAPAISPDGKKFVFISSRDLFSIDMFIGDTSTGKVTKKLTRTALDPHFQSIQFIYSAGSWDADSRRFVFGAVSEGKPVLAIVDAEGKSVREPIRFPQLGEILNPTWAPDGRRIAFSALSQAMSDIYVYDLESGALTNLTNDAYGDLQPVWSPDGRWIAFVTERFTADVANVSLGNYEIALLDVQSGEIKPVPGFKDGKNITPQWSPDSRTLFFISDHNGVSNVYRVEIASGALSQVTNLYTGVSGITGLSPALSIATKSNDVLYSVYELGNFSIYSIEPAAVLAGGPVQEITGASPAALPPADRQGSEVLGLLRNSLFGLPDPDKFSVSPYKPKLSLDFVAPPSVGVGVDRFGTYAGGGVAFFFSDMLGFHNLAVIAQVYNRLVDSAVIAQYVNTQHRINYGFAVQRVPYIYPYYSINLVDYHGILAVEEDELLYRTIFNSVLGFGQYPISRFQRVELSAGYNFIQFKNTLYRYISDYSTGIPLAQDEIDLESAPALHMPSVGAALVYDSALFGATAPIVGQSYRLDVSQDFGSLTFTNVLADFRKYVMPLRPFTLAGRVLHYGRWGKDSTDSRLYPMYIGYQTLVRGYDTSGFDLGSIGNDTGAFDFYRLLGSRIAVLNLELRFPLFGALGIGKGFYGIFPLDVIAFYDAGLAWGIDFGYGVGKFDLKNAVSSYGVGVRVNLFGALVLGLNYVYPISWPDRGAHIEFTFYPGF